MAFAATIVLEDLDGTAGVRMDGPAGALAGFAVAGAGDVNGDGMADFVIGAPQVGAYDHGAAYVVFGRNGGFGAGVSLADLDGTDGFRLSGSAGDVLGRSVASAGDINGDGFDDIIVGRVGTYDSLRGGAFVVFGKAGGFAASINPYSLDGTDGFRISALLGGDDLSSSIASAGDINGDGFDDLIVGAAFADPNGSSSGASYVVFGGAGGWAANLSVGDLDGTNGFRIAGLAANDQNGRSVSSAGDINGDGIGDLMVGSPGRDGAVGGDSGSVHVIFGHAGPWGSNFDLAGLDGTNGFELTGARVGESLPSALAPAGDVNGDGIVDLIVGAKRVQPNGGLSGAAYVVFGKAGGFAASLDVATLDGTNGFKLSGEALNDQAAISVDGAGDINGDGFADLIVGAYRNSPGGVNFAGAAYVVYGKAGGWDPNLNLSALNGTNGFKLVGAVANDQVGNSVAGAGDVDGDGIDDLIVGAPGVNGGAGAVYILYGEAAPVAIVLDGGAGNDSLDGGAGDDVLRGLGGNDVLSGLDGNDELDGGDHADALYGGAGADDLIGGAGGDWLQGDDGDDMLAGDQGGDKLFGGLGADALDGGADNDRLDGGDGIDTLLGGAGNDHLDGGTGADVMTGGTGNDVYLVDEAGDQTIELAGEGYDIVRTALSWTLGDHIEGLELQGGADVDATGNTGANNLQGNAGNNTLSGLSGVDTINGGDGDDVIIGGEGNDLLRGGAGADVFLVAHAFGPALETDQVYDFATADGDVIDLSGAYAGTLELVAGFTKAAGQVTLTFAGGITTLRLDIDGDGRPDYQMKINGDVTGDSGGWVL